MGVENGILFIDRKSSHIIVIPPREAGQVTDHKVKQLAKRHDLPRDAFSKVVNDI